MLWVKGLIGARWFPYVAIGVVSSAGIVFGWGYMKGYSKAEITYQEAMNEALASQLKRLSTIHAQDMATAAQKMERINNVRDRIKDVLRPDCTIPVECLRAFNDGVRATGSHTEGADAAP